MVDDWHKILLVRSLVLKPQEDTRPWLEFAAMCRKSSRFSLAKKTLVSLLGHDPDLMPDKPLSITCPNASYEYAKYLYAQQGHHIDAFKLVSLTEHWLTIPGSVCANNDKPTVCFILCIYHCSLSHLLMYLQQIEHVCQPLGPGMHRTSQRERRELEAAHIQGLPQAWRMVSNDHKSAMLTGVAARFFY